MRQNRFVLLSFVAGLVWAGTASAAGFGLFQHGGRAMGQVGAFTARASEPSAVTYNPAGIVDLDGFQAQAGLDFNNSEDEYASSTGSFSARHIIDFPPAVYATWKPHGASWAMGIGIDAPFWYKVNWDPALFPARFRHRQLELTTFEVHPVLAWNLGGGWSLGGGVRYVYGDLEQGDNQLFQVAYTPSPSGPVQFAQVEVERNWSSNVDDLAWDLGLRYAAPSGGWGVVYRSPAQLKGNGHVSTSARPTGIAQVDSTVANALRGGGVRQAFEIPREVRGGFWFAPYPELRFELDSDWQSWSSLENTAVTFGPDNIGGGGTMLTRRDWKDTIDLRLGMEGDITDSFMLYGGISREASPVPGSTIEPGFPRGDAWVYGAGFSYSLPQISFDVGYSFHQQEDRGASNQEVLHPGLSSQYRSRSQVWGFSVRWRR
jgi:long-chain fatty acid transport protein